MRTILLMAFMITLSVGHATIPEAEDKPAMPPEENKCEQLYHELGLSEKVAFEAFEHAYSGYHEITGKQKEVLTLIDFTKASTEERMFVIDMGRRELLFSTHVAHGQNSGGNYATSFSNRVGSHQSSLGFYLTENTYIGRSGYSLRLNGLEPGINDNAKARAVVIHAARYANPSVIGSMGRLGRSHGCPALPEKVNRPVIDEIKDGSVLFIYAGDDGYLAESSFISPNPTDVRPGPFDS